ncbi:hypothetical protein HGRIS_010522 [Hohenbuehelia grisea]|uniref:WSC domain-containing protein n=1 Tax=Hohenbuehelia grisea TaxID=104357 RepID=A0ABR3IX44_9AGAR
MPCGCCWDRQHEEYKKWWASDLVARPIFFGAEKMFFVVFFLFVEKVFAQNAITSLGCYTATSVSRTLSAASFTDAGALTVETCRSFCSNGDFSYFGVEYSRECYCDYSIHTPGALTASSECNMPCTGNISQTCGGPNRISLYRTAGTPEPAVKQRVISWQYQGCFQDIPVTRVLSRRIPLAGENSAEKCTSACKAASYLYAGLEFADECWCGNFLGTTPQKPEEDCSLRCTGDHSEICGGSARLTIYKDTDPASYNPQTCVSLDNPMFNLQAWPKTPPPPGGPFDFPEFYGIKPIDVGNNFAILSWCEGCAQGASWRYNSIVQGRLIPANVGFPKTVALKLDPGESPSFISIPVDDPWPAYNGYCAMVDPSLGRDSPPNFFAAAGRSDLWSLCSNVTADFRLDLVYAARSGHPHYSLSSCAPVWLKMA